MGLPKNTAEHSLKKRGRGFTAAEISLGPCRQFLKRTLQGIPKKVAAGWNSFSPCRGFQKGRCRGFPEQALQGIQKKSLQAGLCFSTCRGFQIGTLQGISRTGAAGDSKKVAAGWSIFQPLQRIPKKDAAGDFQNRRCRGFQKSRCRLEYIPVPAGDSKMSLQAGL
jgi:hypothetical protein